MADDPPFAALEEIRERADAATRGPWETTERHGRGYDDEGWSELTVKSPDDIVAMTYWTDALETENAEADGAFIAAARSDVPRLLAVVDKVLAAHHNADGRCAWCRNPDGQRQKWPCGEYLAISRELTGEGGTDVTAD